MAIDVNAGYGHWPFYPTAPRSVADLESVLREAGVERACAYPLEAYLFPDPQDANERRLPELAASSFFLPSAVLNPTLPNVWHSLGICRQRWEVPLVRLLPSYHQYRVDAPVVDTLARELDREQVVLAVHIRAQDERAHNPIAQVPPVSFAEVSSLAERHAKLRVIAVGAYAHEIAQTARRAPLPDNLYVELSFVESEDPLSDALRVCAPERLLFGTHAPLFYPLANVYKVEHSEASSDAKRRALHQNAADLFKLM